MKNREYRLVRTEQGNVHELYELQIFECYYLIF